MDFTPKTWGGEELVSADLNEQVRDPFVDLQDSWVSYTPSWTSTGTAPSLDNGSRAGRWKRVGKTILWRISFQFGSTTTFGTGFYKFGLPDSLDWNEHDAIGSGTVLDFSTTTVYGFTAVYDGAGSVRGYFGDGSKLGATTPFVPSTSDRIIISGMGELA